MSDSINFQIKLIGPNYPLDEISKNWSIYYLPWFFASLYVNLDRALVGSSLQRCSQFSQSDDFFDNIPSLWINPDCRDLFCDSRVEVLLDHRVTSSKARPPAQPCEWLPLWNQLGLMTKGIISSFSSLFLVPTLFFSKYPS